MRARGPSVFAPCRCRWQATIEGCYFKDATCMCVHVPAVATILAPGSRPRAPMRVRCCPPNHPAPGAAWSAGATQVLDVGSGEVVVLFGTSEGALFLLRLLVPRSPGCSPDDIQVRRRARGHALRTEWGHVAKSCPQSHIRRCGSRGCVYGHAGRSRNPGARAHHCALGCTDDGYITRVAGRPLTLLLVLLLPPAQILGIPGGLDEDSSTLDPWQISHRGAITAVDLHPDNKVGGVGGASNGMHLLPCP